MKNSHFYLLASLLLASCSSSNIENIGNGIVVNVPATDSTSAQKVRLEVLGEKLIPQDRKVEYTIEETDKSVSLKTSELIATLSKNTGEIKFFDKNGNVILEEEHGGGRTFTTIEVEGTKGYSIRQVFESPADEAFYGLGQHQADEFNYKGKNEELRNFARQLFIVPFR